MLQQFPPASAVVPELENREFWFRFVLEILPLVGSVVEVLGQLLHCFRIPGTQRDVREVLLSGTVDMEVLHPTLTGLIRLWLLRGCPEEVLCFPSELEAEGLEELCDLGVEVCNCLAVLDHE